ncbi:MULTISPECIES: entericidin A/B family lipoprotein [unclassified Gilliamella]|nr:MULTISPECIES: entericidin A/B family lipoprotein [Gilliamella]MCX8642826.1 entericidin A/B family lipoprotein [Gilliamella sp. B3835]MCX8708215.1 entericidin A/B family lipoprotein [Gilliamella sp. B3783]MCX8710113.1 entericidin A/B family lipoprotein [Gilliamella sp. B3780]MCX8712721.1 entericidin A/B family lipoprotein [Gilliamella sp. B3468]MCX8715389.1 entericidin A/B family lipoprotein [Gilliamella sp. B3781]
MLQKMLIIVFGLVMTTLVTGCNTVNGVGKDVQSGGKAISNTAEKVSDKM